MSEPIQLPPLTPYSGWSHPGERNSSHARRRSHASPPANPSQSPTGSDEDEPSAIEEKSDRPGHLVDYQA